MSATKDYSDARTALAVVDKARDSGMSDPMIAAFLGLDSTDTFRKWGNPIKNVHPKTARAVRRLDRRLK